MRKKIAIDADLVGAWIYLIVWCGLWIALGGYLLFLIAREAVDYCDAHPWSGEAIGLYLLGGAALLAALAFLAALGVHLQRERRGKQGSRAANLLGFGTAGIVMLGALVGCGFFLANVHIPDSTSSPGFCESHTCIANFANGTGSVVQCADGQWSHSGGIQGACSGHGGEGGGPSSSSGEVGGASPAPTPAPTVPPASPRRHANDFCASHQCIPSFRTGKGSIVQCADGQWSHSGGNPGACSHHGGLTHVAPSSPSPATPAPVVPKSSHPALTGSRAAAAGGFSIRITHLGAEHSLDETGLGASPEYGITFDATCAEPGDLPVLWAIKAGGSPSASTTATCISGRLMPQQLVVAGCASRVLSVTPREATGRRRSGPFHFPFKVC